MNDVKVLANAIRLELLTELRTARSPTARRGAVPDDPDGAAAHEGADEGPAGQWRDVPTVKRPWQLTAPWVCRSAGWRQKRRRKGKGKR